MRIQTCLDHTCQLGEGPIWDAQQRTILWVDILSNRIHLFQPHSAILQTIQTPDMVGAIAICEDGNYLAALKSELAIINRKTNEIESITDLEEHLPNNRCNDGKCDAKGRFWIGSMSLDQSSGKGSLYLVENSKKLELKIAGVTISNGMAWSADNKTMYYIDTPTREVNAFDFDLLNGNITNKKIILTIPKNEGHPDGMTIDTDGMLWIAHWGGWKVARYNPHTGAKLMEIKLPVSQVTSCTFGSDDFSKLYVTSAKVGLSKDQLEKEPLAGSLFCVEDTGCKGLESYKYKNI